MARDKDREESYRDVRVSRLPNHPFQNCLELI
ncbi:hypothetical protein CCACVL1_02154 [Corchorus capsularis]|uniref:Uncharacterized protein n=1 Tax=Corchorus capsularis TaxID=210143 RepID=A0A1R3KBX3_COCAP|nr:hypothetical protein CCACVL1_22399 [Corchorus capsularis]OMP04575.1 hypothetical protein CCACVL1_02154 [Corchorus capsularis]